MTHTFFFNLKFVFKIVLKCTMSKKVDIAFTKLDDVIEGGNPYLR